jgi:hypothetical protein
MQGYKTFITAIILALFGVIAQTDWIAVLNNPKGGLVALGCAIIMAVMRSITITPPPWIKQKETGFIAGDNDAPNSASTKSVT